MIPGLSLFPEPSETIEGVARMLRDGSTTCESVVGRCLGRIGTLDSEVRAWALVDGEGALSQARERDRELREGTDRGPLHGIPFGIKDIIDVAGLPTSAGARLWAEGPAAEDAEIVARLRKAGAVILGKTVTTPYAWVDPPPTRNPWDFDRTPGGSSSGSAAALACGMCLGALGTQTGGSLTRPAAFCGLASFKPTDGLWLSGGIAPLAPSLDTPGIMARTVDDLEKTWEGLIGEGLFRPDPSFNRSKPPAYNPNQPPILGRARGFFRDLIEPSARMTHEAALMDLARAGAELVDVDLPESFFDVHRPHRIVMAAEAASIHASRLARVPKDYPPMIRALVEEGRAIPAPDYIQALDLRHRLREAIDWSISGIHALVVPAALGPAPGLETTGDPSFNSPWNFAQLPTVSFPIGLSGDGLPLAVQVIGHRFDAPFGVARWCEQVIRRSRS